MPFIQNELGADSKGGTEMMVRGLEKRLAETRPDLLQAFDIHPSRVRNFNTQKPSILWAHDLPGDPEADHLKRDGGARFKAMVFVSDWQEQRFNEHYKLDGSNSFVINNAIDPILPNKLSKWDATIHPLGSAENPIRLIYHTTPHRGLQILVPVYEALYQRWQELGIHTVLDVYSSFSIYGDIWEQRNDPYRELFKRCEAHPGINYHGAQPNEVVREALKNAHVFAFPSIWPETSCIAMIEAMDAHCAVVHSNYGALPETSGGLTYQYSYCNNPNDHASRFATCLAEVVGLIAAEKYNEIRYMTFLAQARVNMLYRWDRALMKWTALLEGLNSPVAS